MSIITFSLSRSTVEVSHVAAGEHMIPGPFHLMSNPEHVNIFTEMARTTKILEKHLFI
jgi:hypothetical protein